MTDLQRDIRIAILRALLAANGSMSERALKQHVRNVFTSVAFTDGDLTTHIISCEQAKLIAGTNDPVFGMMWALTVDGKISAQQLR